MPLREEFTLAVHDHFEQRALQLAAAAAPKPWPRHLLASEQALARQSPQPDRLLAVRAARVPLIEAARPLLLAQVHLPRRLDAAHAIALHSDLQREVASFQSVCGDALVRKEYITGASYMLCTALDEAAGLSLRKVGSSSGIDTWAGRLLAVQFHGDGKGGENVFRLMANLLQRPADHLDLLELLLILIALGFEGSYRQAANGKRVLDDIRHTLFSTVRSCRGDGMRVAHWKAIESLLWERVPPGELAGAAQALFQ
ncbi:type IVB secretion system protein IcmH/DotU [Variovorax paradoxus]|uniref:type IVB secretion system protein IcmH/DotU n=1 Tax=Variovorax paradoxus TaxID=34073 RepID=UPI00069C672A|nr:type IVB secretion system protein IcmH/DotU [Variovorax paradoxus]